MKRRVDAFLLAGVTILAITATSLAQQPVPVTTTLSVHVDTPTITPLPSSTTNQPPTTASVSPTATQTHASSGVAPASSTVLTPTSTPTPELLYRVNDTEDNSTTCILLVAPAIVVSVSFITTDFDKVQKMDFTLTKALSWDDSSRSYCTKKGDHANLTVAWFTHAESNVFHYLQFQFTRQRYNWKLGAIELTLNTTDGEFMNMSNTTNTNTSEFRFLYEELVFVNEYERAYECRNGQAFTLTNTADNDGVMNDTIVELEPTWRIQAFEFRDDGSDFGNSRMCPQSIQKNVKLPAIVGGVLLLLLSAVAVVYIVSRLRRRKLTSYERLN